jgi:hypothetical protein
LLLVILASSLAATGAMAGKQPKPACPVEQTGFGFLDCPAYSTSWEHRPPYTPYSPQPGDIMFCTDDVLIFLTGHILSGAGQPTHSAVFFRRPDGQLAILEAGPFNSSHIGILEPLEHLRNYEQKGTVWIRPRSCPLTEEQSARLTHFAMCQEGKRFAWARMYSLITPVRTRGPIRTYFVGKSHGGDRDKYYCAELAAEAIVASGAIDAADSRPAATFPSDLFYDGRKNPFLKHHFKLSEHGWGVPSHWSSCAGSCGGCAPTGEPVIMVPGVTTDH